MTFMGNILIPLQKYELRIVFLQVFDQRDNFVDLFAFKTDLQSTGFTVNWLCPGIRCCNLTNINE